MCVTISCQCALSCLGRCFWFLVMNIFTFLWALELFCNCVRRVYICICICTCVQLPLVPIRVTSGSRKGIRPKLLPNASKVLRWCVDALVSTSDTWTPESTALHLDVCMCVVGVAATGQYCPWGVHQHVHEVTQKTCNGSHPLCRCWDVRWHYCYYQFYDLCHFQILFYLFII